MNIKHLINTIAILLAFVVVFGAVVIIGSGVLSLREAKAKIESPRIAKINTAAPT